MHVQMEWYSEVFLHVVNLHSLTLAQMCGCAQESLATLQAKVGTHTHTQTASLNNIGEGYRGKCVNTSVNVALLAVFSIVAILTNASDLS